MSAVHAAPAADNLTPAQRAIRDEQQDKLRHPRSVEYDYVPATGEEVDKIRLYAYFTGAASCGSKSAWTCKSCQYPGTAGTAVGLEINDIKTDTTGYVAVNPNLKAIIVAFRGTSDPAGWGQNLQFSLKDFSDLGKDVSVHKGFQQNFYAARDQVRSQVAQYRQQHPELTSISVAGHSLGGAIATLVAQDIARLHADMPVNLYTYGSPRVGNTAFATAVNRISNLKFMRFTNFNDAIPHLPPPLFGYRHSDLEFWSKNYNSTNVVRCNSGEDASCANSAFPIFGDVHGWAVGVRLAPGC